MADLLSVAECERVAALGGLDARTQSELGQFFTPAVAAQLIASIPRLPESGTLRVLDPGAVSSAHRTAMRAAGVDAPNLYAAFLSLSVAALRIGGQVVAITPRSFFNGPYFGAFRAHLLDSIALDRVHVFDSRSTVFADTGVLQENVIFAGTRGVTASVVELSVSRDHTDDVSTRSVAYEEVVFPNDPNRFIRLAIDADDTAVAEVVLSQPWPLRPYSGSRLGNE